MRKLKFIGYLSTLPAIILAAVLILGFTPFGLRLAIKLAEHLFPGQLSIQSSEGRLFGNIILHGIHYKEPSKEFTVKSTRLTWHPAALLYGKLDVEQLTLQQITLKTDELPQVITAQQLSLTGSSRWHWHEGRQWQAHVTSRGIDTLQSWSTPKSAINLAFTSKGHYQSGHFYSEIHLEQLSGNIGPQPLTGKGLILFNNNTWVIQDLTATAGTAQLYVNGTFAEKFNLTWRVEIPHFRDLLEQAKGSFSSQGEIAGTPEFPIIKGQIFIHDFAFKQQQIQEFNSEIAIDLRTKQLSKIQLNAHQIKLSNLNIDKAEAELQGDLRQQRFSGILQNSANRLQIKLSGNLTNPKHWTGSINQLTLRSTQFGDWSLQQAVALAINSQSIQIKSFCWTSQQQQLCGQADWTPQEGLKTQITTRNVSLALFNPFLPAKIGFNGALNLNAQLTFDPQQQMNAKYQAQVGAGNLIYRNAGQAEHSLFFHDAKLEGAISPKGTTAALQLYILDEPAHIQLSLPNYTVRELPTPQQPLQGHAAFSLKRLDFLEALIPHISNVQGNFNATLDLAGTLAKPDIKTKATLANTKFDIPQLGITVSRVQGTAVNSGSNQINYQLSGWTKTGSFTAAGKTLLNALDFSSEIAIKGKNVLLADTPSYTIQATPQVKLTTKGSTMNLTGEIFIPRALLQSQQFGQQIVELPNDIVIIGNNIQPSSGTPINFTVNLDILLGRHVTLATHNLQGHVEGRLNINVRPQFPTLGTGQLVIKKGKYLVYGETLTISNGSLTFTGGPVDDPGVLVEATKTISTGPGEQIIVGIRASGRIKNPQINLFSDPPTLNQNDILSYILTGAPSSNLGEAQGALVLKAANQLNIGGLGQFDALKQNLRSSFGLEQLDIGTISQYSKQAKGMVQTTSLNLGKTLAPHLYLSYSIGLQESINVLTLRYLLTKKLSVQTQTTGENSGIDLLYTIER